MGEMSRHFVLCINEKHLHSKNFMLIRLKIVFPSSATNTTHCTSLPTLWPDDGVWAEVICGAIASLRNAITASLNESYWGVICSTFFVLVFVFCLQDNKLNLDHWCMIMFKICSLRMFFFSLRERSPCLQYGRGRLRHRNLFLFVNYSF